MPSPLAALSPLDGRYSRSADPLRGYFSEQALIRYRVRIELEWLQALAAERAFKELKPFSKQSLSALSPGDQDLRGARCGAHQEHRGRDQPRRQGDRALAALAPGEERRGAARAGIHPLRLHLGGHQQPRLRADDRRVAREGDAAEAGRSHRFTQESGTQACRAAHALAHARPGGDADHARQGDRQLRAPAGARARRASPRWRCSARSTARWATTTRTSPPTPASTGRRFCRRFVERLGLRIQRLHHADRAARLARRAARRLCARQQRAARPRPRPVGLHLARLFPPEGEGGRGRLLDHAAQGEPDRLRELRGQRRHRQRAAAPPRGEAAGVALAARPLRLDRAAQRRHRARPHAARLRRLPARPRQAARPTRRASPPTSRRTGKCSPRRCSR